MKVKLANELQKLVDAHNAASLAAFREENAAAIAAGSFEMEESADKVVIYSESIEPFDIDWCGRVIVRPVTAGGERCGVRLVLVR